jgi:hypothetical protein
MRRVWAARFLSIFLALSFSRFGGESTQLPHTVEHWINRR